MAISPFRAPAADESSETIPSAMLHQSASSVSIVSFPFVPPLEVLPRTRFDLIPCYEFIAIPVQPTESLHGVRQGA